MPIGPFTNFHLLHSQQFFSPLLASNSQDEVGVGQNIRNYILDLVVSLLCYFEVSTLSVLKLS